MAEDIFSILGVPKKRIGISGTASSPASGSEPSISSARSDIGSHPTLGTESTESPTRNVGEDIQQTTSITVNESKHARRAQQIPSTNHAQMTEIGPIAERDEELSAIVSRLTDADIASALTNGLWRAKVTEVDRLRFYTDRQTAHEIKATFLEDVVPGFKSGSPVPLRIYYCEAKTSSYRLHLGGSTWSPHVPDDIASDGDIVTVMVSVLTREDFVRGLPRFELSNLSRVPSMNDRVMLGPFGLVGNDLQLEVLQEPPLEGVSSYSIHGETAQSFRSASGVFSLEFKIADVFGNLRPVRVYSDGHRMISLGLQSGDGFRRVQFLSSDGARLRVTTRLDPSKLNVSTIYLKEPSSLYSLGQMYEKPLEFKISRVSKAFQVGQTTPVRKLEKTIVQQGSKYDSGRIGSEVAYAVAKDKLGLKDVIMMEPAKGGKDLYTKDRQVVIQARMLRMNDQSAGRSWREKFERELNQMVWKLVKQDFPYNPWANIGYAILSYSDEMGLITSIVLKVDRPRITPSRKDNPRAR